MEVFHVIIPLRHAAVARSALMPHLPERNDLFMWCCSPRAVAETICMACEGLPSHLMRYIDMLDPENMDRFFFWKVDNESMVLLETNVAASASELGSKVSFKDLVFLAGYRLKRIDGQAR